MRSVTMRCDKIGLYLADTNRSCVISSNCHILLGQIVSDDLGLMRSCVRPTVRRFVTEMKSLKHGRPSSAVNSRPTMASFITVTTDRLGNVYHTCRRSAAMRSQCPPRHLPSRACAPRCPQDVCSLPYICPRSIYRTFAPRHLPPDI